MGPSVITIPLHGEAKSSATLFLSSAEPRSAAPSESDLLRKIKLVLRGSDTDHISSIQSSVFLNSVSDTWEEEELTWNAHSVVVGSGGVMRKKWNFSEEGQSIQWACIGLLEQTTLPPSLQAHSTARYADLDSDSSDRPTFGPFAQLQREQKSEVGPVQLIPAVFVFLRSIGRIFLRNGFEYTFSLPFIVRKAWPISPHGVMIQRVLEPTELHDAEITGDPVLPTIFSMTSPFAEAAAIGLTTGIIGGVEGTPAALKDEDENSTKPLKAFAPTEMVVWVSHRGPHAADDVAVTVDVEQKRLSICVMCMSNQRMLPFLSVARQLNLSIESVNQWVVVTAVAGHQPSITMCLTGGTVICHRAYDQENRRLDQSSEMRMSLRYLACLPLCRRLRH